MSYENIIYETNEGIAKIIINRPDVLNALNPVVISEIKKAVEESGKDDNVNVVVLTGSGRAFCAGVDLKSVGSIDSADAREDLNSSARDLQTTIETLPKVVIAMLNGFCLTGGLEIALSCDLIVAAGEAKIGDTHVKWGLRCNWGMSQRLSYRVGELKAQEMTYTGEMITGSEAARIGLVNTAVPLDELESTVHEMAKKIAENSSDAIAAHKVLYYQSKKDAMGKGLQREYTTMPEIRDTVERIVGFAKKS